jgi:hypothetical protein
MFEVIFAICFTVQNVSVPLLILTERSIMAHIAIILSENNLSDIIIEEIVCRNTEQNGHHFLCRQKNITSNRTCTTLVLSSKFCTDIIFSLGNMKLFVSFFHITAVKRCHSQNNLIIFFINIINITEKNGYVGLYQ